MTPFSTLLSAHIKNRNIRTQQLASYCGVDRSNMYKLINGKRNPVSEETVIKIADFLKLTLTDRKDFLEAYHITLTGYDTYYRRKNVQQFIKDFSLIPSVESSFSATLTAHVKDFSNQQCISLKNKEEIYPVICHILTEETKKKEGCIQLVLQPSSGYFMEILSYICKNTCNLKVEHIICLNNTSDITEKKTDYNLNCLQEILPLYYTCHCNYTPFYYYDNILSHNNIYNLFSSMVITSDYVLIFSTALQYGVLFLQQETTDNLRELFSSLKSEAAPVICKIDSMFTQFSYFDSLNVNNTPTFSFQQQPCIVPLMPSSFLEKYIIGHLPHRADFIDSAALYIKRRTEDFHTQPSQFLFAESGISHFLKTGRAFEFPEQLYTPIEKHDRLLILHNLIEGCKEEKFRMLRPEAPIVQSSLCIFVGSQQGYLQFLDANENLVYLNLEEPGLLFSFYDYLESLSPDWFYSTEETISILKTLPRKLL